MKAAFTRHAWERVLGRLTLGPGELAQILDWDLCVDVGIEPGTPRVHRLFYSVPDGACFVAIQDHRNGAVITVLPLDYHWTSAWHVAPEALMRAESLVRGEVQTAAPRPASSRPAVPLPPAPPPTPRTPAVPSRPANFHVTAYYRQDDGAVRATKLGAWPCDAYDGRLELLLEDDGFFEAIGHWMAERQIHPARVDALYARAGRDGVPIRITWSPADLGA